MRSSVGMASGTTSSGGDFFGCGWRYGTHLGSSGADGVDELDMRQPRLHREIAAIDGQDRTGDEAGSRRGEKNDRVGDLFGPAPSAHRRAGEDGPAALGIVLQGLGERGDDPAWGDGVDANAVLPPGCSEALRELADAAFGRAVAGRTRSAEEG